MDAQILTYATIGYFLMTRERLFSDLYVRCNHTSKDGRQAHFGRFDSKGVRFQSYPAGSPHEKLGVSSVWKTMT